VRHTGAAVSPVIVNARAYGSADALAHPSELAPAALELPTTLRRLAELPELAERTANADVALMVMDHEARVRNKVFRGGTVDGRRWQKAVESVGPDRYSAALDVSLLHAELRVGDEATPPSVEWTVRDRSGGAVDGVASVLFEWLVSVAAGDGVVTGAISVDTVPMPYETWVVRPLWSGRIDDERYVPGYEWAVVLRRGHVAALGGMEAVKADAPVVEVVEVGPDTVVCRLTDSPLEVPDEARARWRRYLRPVLAPGFAVRQDDQLPTGLLERPVLPVGVQGALRAAPGTADWSRTAPPVDGAAGVEGPHTVMAPWREPPKDADEIDVWRTIVAAWVWIGAKQGFRDVEGVLAGHGEPVSDDDGISVEVDFGPCDPVVCLEVLSHALGNAGLELGVAGEERFGTIHLR